VIAKSAEDDAPLPLCGYETKEATQKKISLAQCFTPGATGLVSAQGDLMKRTLHAHYMISWDPRGRTNLPLEGRKIVCDKMRLRGLCSGFRRHYQSQCHTVFEKFPGYERSVLAWASACFRNPARPRKALKPIWIKNVTVMRGTVFLRLSSESENEPSTFKFRRRTSSKPVLEPTSESTEPVYFCNPLTKAY